MPRNASGDMRHVRAEDAYPNVAALLIARALAEVYRDTLNEPIPERLAAVLRQIETWENRHGPDAA
jgi:hypothetical protein